MRRFALALIAASSVALAQDFPYENAPETAADAKAPVESPQTAKALQVATEKPKSKKAPALFRVGFKGGGVFGYESAMTTTVTGLGFEALLSLNWDFPYQPISIEVLTGYRNLFFGSTSAEHIFPVQVNVAYRERIAHRTLWKLGLGVSPDVRFVRDADTSTTLEPGSTIVISPALTVFSTFDFSGFVLEPAAIFYGYMSQAKFFAFALRGGYLF